MHEISLENFRAEERFVFLEGHYGYFHEGYRVFEIRQRDFSSLFFFFFSSVWGRAKRKFLFSVRTRRKRNVEEMFDLWGEETDLMDVKEDGDIFAIHGFKTSVQNLLILWIVNYR